MDLHIFFLPFLAPGHMIPMLDMAKLVAIRGVNVTVVTTTGNTPRIQPSLDHFPHPIQLLTIPFPSPLPDNLTHFPNPNPTPEFQAALDALESPFRDLVSEHRPDCIVSDLLYPWSAHVAADHRIPRIYFTATTCFTNVVARAVRSLGPTLPDNRPFVVPTIPHRVEMLKSQLSHGSTANDDRYAKLLEAHKKTLGAIVNSFYELESEYADSAGKAWLVGPVALCDAVGRAVRGGGGCGFDGCSKWLESKKPQSVLYVSFGTLCMFTASQLREIAAGLISSGHPFVWVVRDADGISEWMPEEGIPDEKGFVLKGWAPQMVILNHPSVGGFLTHCGWNSCLEGAVSGLPMVTWPLFGEQFFSERLSVDVLRIAVAVGCKVCSYSKDDRTMVGGEEVRKAIEEVMGSGEEARERRKRAKEIAEKARKAMEEGGSSYNNLTNMIQELKEIKARKNIDQETVISQDNGDQYV